VKKHADPAGDEPHAVLATYRFKASTSIDDVRTLLRDHAAVLLEQGLRTPREPWILVSLSDPRQVLEVFEWVDATAADRAHENPAVMELWGRFGALADEVGVAPGALAEAGEPFPHFRSLGG